MTPATCLAGWLAGFVQTDILGKIEHNIPGTAESRLGLGSFATRLFDVWRMLARSAVDTPSYTRMVVGRVLRRGGPPLHIGGGGNYFLWMSGWLPCWLNNWVLRLGLGMLPHSKAVAVAAAARARVPEQGKGERR
jgi:hypothetical protein